MIDQTLLKELAEKNDISLNDTALERFDTYAARLVEWNEKINLTAITDPEEIVYKHFLDCLMLTKYVEFPEGATVIDVGTGAGFPGLVLKIARPDLELTLLDGTLKRLNVINEIQTELGLSTNLVHKRAEDGGKDPALRASFDYSTARAVTSLRNLAELCIPYLKVGGAFLPMKGPDVAEEIKEAGNGIALLGGKRKETFTYDLDGKGEHNILYIEKIKETPNRYPRPMAKIKKEPLGRKIK